MTVFCGDASCFCCIKSNLTRNNDTLYIKTNDIINLQDVITSSFLRSHDVTFTIGDKTFQEVVGHQERIGGNDEVIFKSKII